MYGVFINLATSSWKPRS